VSEFTLVLDGGPPAAVSISSPAVWTGGTSSCFGSCDVLVGLTVDTDNLLNSFCAVMSLATSKTVVSVAAHNFNLFTALL
jgi:hypothetical protein